MNNTRLEKLPIMKTKEGSMFTMWLLHDLTVCVRCRAKFQLFYNWHYGLTREKKAN